MQNDLEYISVTPANSSRPYGTDPRCVSTGSLMLLVRIIRPDILDDAFHQRRFILIHPQCAKSESPTTGHRRQASHLPLLTCPGRDSHVSPWVTDLVFQATVSSEISPQHRLHKACFSNYHAPEYAV